MKKLLHVGLCATGTPHNGIQRAFINQFEYREINTASTNLNKKILEVAVNYKPDLTFIQIQTDGIINEQTIIELKKHSHKVFNFTGDVRRPVPDWYLQLGKHIDLTLFTNMDDVNTLRSKGIKSDFLELGIDETIFSPTGQKVISKPIVFFGNNYGLNRFPLSGERIEMVRFLKHKYPNQFALYGTGWNGMESGNVNHSQDKEAAIYRGSKIGINLSHFNSDSYSSDRLLRILATGTMCLCKNFINIEKRFTGQYHLMVWNRLEDLEAMINYYLKPENEEERLWVANNGMQLCHSKYTFNHMVTEIKRLYLNN